MSARAALPRRRLAHVLRAAVRDIWRGQPVAWLAAALLAWPTVGYAPAVTYALAALLAGAHATVSRMESPSGTDEVLAALARALALLVATVGAPAAWLAALPGGWLAGLPRGGLVEWVGVPAYVVALALLVIATHTPRARSRVMWGLRTALAEALHVDPRHVAASWWPRRWGAHWWALDANRTRLDRVEVSYPRGSDLSGARGSLREHVGTVVRRELGPDVQVRLVAARRRVEISRLPELPRRLTYLPVTINGQPPRYPVVAVGPEGVGLPIDDAGRPVIHLDFDRDIHTAICGGTGAGKTSCMNHIIRTALDVRAIREIVVFDGKKEGDFARWRNYGVRVIDDPDQFLPAWRDLVEAAERRHEEVLAWREGRAPEPTWRADRTLIVSDEFERIAEASDEIPELTNRYAKTVRSVGGRMIWGTQRLDLGKHFPGSVRDQMSGRIILGGPGALQSAEGWRMAAGDSAGAMRAALGVAEEDDLMASAEVIPGRCAVRLSGRVVAGQAPFLPDPIEATTEAERRQIEALYPPRVPKSGPVRQSEGPRESGRVIPLPHRSEAVKTAPVRDSDEPRDARARMAEAKRRRREVLTDGSQPKETSQSG